MHTGIAPKSLYKYIFMQAGLPHICEDKKQVFFSEKDKINTSEYYAKFGVYTRHIFPSKLHLSQMQ